MAIGSDLLAKLEDGQADGDDEAEERQLQGVPSLETEDSDGQRNEGHGLEEDEHEDRYDDLLELGLAGLNGATLAEFDVEGQFLVVDVAGGHFDGRVQRKLEGHVVGSYVLPDRVQDRALARETATCHLVYGVRVAGDFHGL